MTTRFETPHHAVFVVTEDWYFLTHRLPLARALIGEGAKVSLITNVGAHRATIEASGVRLINLRMDRQGTNPLTEVRRIAALARILRRERPDLVHLVALKPVIVGGVAARLAGVHNVVAAIAGLGSIYVNDTMKYRMLRRGVRTLLPWIIQDGRVIVQHRSDLQAVVATGVDESRVRVVAGVGVDLQAFTAAPEPGGVPVVLMACRMLRDKGIDDFVQAALILTRRGIPARFVLVGGPDLGNPTSLTAGDLRKLDEDGVIEWWGLRTDMPTVLSAATVICLPTRYREGVPKVLMEAAACGRPVVTTDIPGCRDVVENESTGLLVPARDADSLAAAIEALLSQPDLRREFGRRARVRAEEAFAEEQSTEATLAIYGEVVACESR